MTRSIGTPTKIDVGLGVGLFVVAVLSGLYGDEARPGMVVPDSWWHWVLIAVPSLTVAVRRVHPVVATIVATTAQILIWVADLPEFLLAMVVVLYSGASDGSQRALQTAVASSIVLTVMTAVGLRVAEDVSIYQVPLVALTCATAVALGLTSARQAKRAAEVATEMTEARTHYEQAQRNAITKERSAIARELHDVIGHTLATIAVRAEAADRVALQRPEVAAEAITDIANVARSSLDETRQVLAGLRTTERAELSPSPDMDSLRALVTDLAAAGASVTLSENGCDDHVPPAIIMGSAYRIVQECLTNAVKHGGENSTIEVGLFCAAARLEINVSNTTSQAREPLTLGIGLRGMAERATVLGGTFRTDHTGDAFVVNVSLPTNSTRTP